MARAHEVLKSFTLKFQQSNKCLWGIREEEQRKPQRSQILHSQIPPKATNAYGGRREEEQRGRTTKELQELDPLSSPHLEERRFGRIVDLDLLSTFPKEYGRFNGGIEREVSFPRSTME